jgi:glycosyltransferase involved in cell wall biosynthesis
VAGDGPLRRLFPPRDAAALREAVERLLADPELRERLGSAAGARASLGWDDVIERTLEVYRGALEA